MYYDNRFIAYEKVSSSFVLFLYVPKLLFADNYK